MPKRPPRDKQTVRPGRPTTARDLITARLPALAQRARSAAETSEWQVAVMTALGPELANKVNRCSLERGTTVSDFDPLERKMQHSLNSAVMHLHHGDTRIHLIDTPGAPDFLGQSMTALEAVETAHIRRVLERTGWMIEGERGAAVLLGLNPSTLRGRMRKLGLRKPG